MNDDAVIILDPVNRQGIDDGLDAGVRDFAGGNCTVSLMLMGLGGLFAQDWVEWLTSMTYQAASGAGAKNMRELVAQMRAIGVGVRESARRSDLGHPRPGPSASPLPSAPRISPQRRLVLLSRRVLLPWIDSELPGGISREERKGLPRDQQDPAGRTLPSPWTVSASGSAPCGATPRP